MTQNSEDAKEKVEGIEALLARVLRLGSLVAGALLAAGIALMLLGMSVIAPRLITAGLLVLLGTPALRVVAAGAIFVKQRDWYFAAFSLVVLCAMAAGIYFGRGE